VHIDCVVAAGRSISLSRIHDNNNNTVNFQVINMQPKATKQISIQQKYFSQIIMNIISPHLHVFYTTPVTNMKYKMRIPPLLACTLARTAEGQRKKIGASETGFTKDGCSGRGLFTYVQRR
jgi:hypothetical protein